MNNLHEPPAAASIHSNWTKAAPKSKAKPKLKQRPPGAPVATLPENKQAVDLAALLDQYRRDATFRASLIGFADRLLSERGETIAAIARARGWESAMRELHRDERYTVACSDFMADWKLDRLPIIGDEPAGRQALQSWFVPLFLGWADGERPTDVDTLSFGGGMFAGVDVPHQWETDEASRARGRLPRTEATLILTYDPTVETWTDAEDRLLAEALAHRDAIEAEHRDAGYVFADVAHRREQHAHWLYRRLVGGLTFPAIADEENKVLARAKQVSDSTVRVAVKAFADRAKINLTEPKPKI